LSVSDSPLLKASSQSGDALFEYVTNIDLGISTRLTVDELKKILEFPDTMAFKYYESLTLRRDDL
jgi:hypothetical protein